MDTCSWDWGAIGSIAGAIGSFAGAVATLYAARMAWKIYQGWREQKRADVLSIEAKKFLLLIANYRISVINMHSVIMNKSNTIEMMKAELNNTLQSLKELRNFDIFFDEINNKIIIGNSDFFMACYQYLSRIKHAIENHPNIHLGSNNHAKHEFKYIVDEFDRDPCITKKKKELIAILKYEK